MALYLGLSLLVVTALCQSVSGVTTPTAWPKGTYALPMPDVGCQNTHFYWSTGRRWHDTQDLLANNGWSRPLHLRGPYHKNNMQQNFCVKTDYQTADTDPEWGKGEYCIFKKGNFCPNGKFMGGLFISVFIKNEKSITILPMFFVDFAKNLFFHVGFYYQYAIADVRNVTT